MKPSVVGQAGEGVAPRSRHPLPFRDRFEGFNAGVGVSRHHHDMARKTGNVLRGTLRPVTSLCHGERRPPGAVVDSRYFFKFTNADTGAPTPIRNVVADKDYVRLHGRESSQGRRSNAHKVCTDRYNV